MNNKSIDHELQFPLTAWRFWLIVFTALLYCIDIFVQFIVFKSNFEALTSILLFLILGYEVYSRIKDKRTLLGKKYSTIFCFLLLALLAFLYS